MATAQLNYIEGGISASKENGQIVSLTYTALVTGLTATTATAIIPEILSATNMPASGSSIAVSGNTLYLERITPKMIRGETTKAEVELAYNRREGSTESSSATPTLRGGTSLKQITTAIDRDDSQIIVYHTWPADDPDYPGEYQRQGGEISVLVPMSNLYGEFVSQESTPGAITRAWAGYLNADAWQGGAPRTWMCTEATFDLVDDTTSPKTWRFSFTFEYDDQTWDNDTTAVFVDPRTGRPPADLRQQTTPEGGPGILQVKYYPERNFGNTF